MIFVFGSNRAGIHGAGAAKYARQYHGAVIGVGEGLKGTSYALPTMTHQITPLPLGAIQQHVQTFLKFAQDNPQLVFQVTRVGCGLGGQEDFHIAPMFEEAPDNCTFDLHWKTWLGTEKEFWGTF